MLDIKAGLPADAAVNWVDIENCDMTKCQVTRGEHAKLEAEFVSGFIKLFILKLIFS